jgi:hypothetical protein
MAAEALRGWLKAKKRREVFSASLYSAAELAGGTLVFLLTLAFVFLATKILFVVLDPFGRWPDLWVFAVVVLVAALLILDCIRSDRDDMSILMLWMIREYLHIGPRILREGGRQAVQAWRLSQLDVEPGADVLAYLAAKSAAVSQEELMRALPGLNWPRLMAQLPLLDGVLVFRPNASRITLTLPLRLELRRLLRHKPGARAPAEEPQAVPVTEPENLSACDILGVPQNASLAEIKLAYRKRVKECHPDRFAGMDEQSRRLAEEWTKALNAAYETLKAERGAQTARSRS